MTLSERKLRKVIREEIKRTLNEEYIELFTMYDDFNKGVELIKSHFKDWKHGPGWEGDGPSRRQLEDAIEEIKSYLERELKKVR